MNSRPVAIFAVVVVILVGASVWFLYSDYAPHHSSVVENAEAPPPPAPVAPAADPLRYNASTPKVGKVAPPTPSPAVVAPPAAAVTEDDRRIASALEAIPGDSDADHDRTAGLLINLLPTLGKDAQVECAQHITNLISDKEFPKLLPIWRNPSFNPDVLEVIGADLSNRDDKIKMPAWLDAVRNPLHPYHEDAKNDLEVYLGEDYENNVQKWEQGVKRYLENAAREEAEAEK